MSHQVTLKTQIKDKEVLESVLKELGYNFSYNGKIIDYYGKNAGNVDIMISFVKKTNSVGFRFNTEENAYELVGDFWGCGIDKDTFRNSVKKLYIEKKLRVLLTKKRYTVVDKNVEKNGSVKMLARGMVA
ncbi:MAG: DUF1257 domain-containing protein [Methanothrix sp.]|jgi:galactitol-specific phosphotransferase system IIB component|nr:DUF1257 domain-containing protein [Methanothrix sp.]